MASDSSHPADPDPAKGGPAFLASTDSAIGSRLLEGSLREAGIPFETKMHNDKGIARVFMGTSPLGADFYVPAELLERARGCLPGAAQPEDTGTVPPDAPPKSGRRRPLATVITALALVAVLLAFYLTDALLEWFRKLLGF